MIYRSKKDLWLVALVWGGVLLPLAIGIFNVFAPGGNLQLGWALTRVGVIASATVVILTFPLNYEITATQLVARSGVMRWRVPLDSIQKVHASRNPASAPTWSLDRLRVEYLKGGSTRSLYISPEDKQAFMRDLADGVPGLEIRGDSVVRVA
jgi:Bacterial PH domain